MILNFYQIAEMPNSNVPPITYTQEKRILSIYFHSFPFISREGTQKKIKESKENAV